ncbi:hypothetical protein ES319_A01G111900v1, partial [Gossypium barbadense]
DSFWWRADGSDNRKLHWASWDTLCVPKKGGGMGFHNLRCFNLALLGKQEWWCLLSNLNSLSSHYFKAKYFPYCFFIEASEGRNPSYVWRSICAEKGLVNRGSRWRVGT